MAGRRRAGLAGLTRRQGERITIAQNLLETLKGNELDDAIKSIAAQTGLSRQQFNLTSGQFAILDSEMGFQLVPWKPEIEPLLGKQLSGIARPGGGVEWELGRERGMGR